MRLWRRGERRTTTATGPTGGVDLDERDDLDDLDELGALDDRDGLDEPAGPVQPGGTGGAGGPVMLMLTTREQVEKAAVAEAAPKVVRVRPGRGAFGGTASGGGCGPGCSH
ncbi:MULTISPECIES: hypothetical protein [Pseudofrankia]|uniref:hypothetical protein n=1 Tax=Pseudofrankia TaxID=2994363 RepID=UPI000234D483|nr:MULTISPECIES: hypothetical protein [Pseudofrankia]OHV41791.1 hypothetical protein BCD49_02545 [Pseudofrankia sp. EUN1h]